MTYIRFLSVTDKGQLDVPPSLKALGKLLEEEIEKTSKKEDIGKPRTIFPLEFKKSEESISITVMVTFPF